MLDLPQNTYHGPSPSKHRLPETGRTWPVKEGDKKLHATKPPPPCTVSSCVLGRHRKRVKRLLLFNPHNHLRGRNYNYPRGVDAEMGAQRGEVSRRWVSRRAVCFQPRVPALKALEKDVDTNVPHRKPFSNTG